MFLLFNVKNSKELNENQVKVFFGYKNSKPAKMKKLQEMQRESTSEDLFEVNHLENTVGIPHKHQEVVGCPPNGKTAPAFVVGSHTVNEQPMVKNSLPSSKDLSNSPAQPPRDYSDSPS